jgi:hypothetical protein
VPPVVVAVCLLALIVGALRAAPQSAPAAPSTPAAAPAAARTYVGSAACAQCHAAVSETFAVTEMGRVLLYAPRSGKETRRMITRQGEAVADAGKEIVDAGRDMFERGRQLVDDAADLFERGRRLVKG